MMGSGKTKKEKDSPFKTASSKQTTKSLEQFMAQD